MGGVGGTVPVMEMITATWQSATGGVPTALVALVDEMQEDPHCRATLLGTDADGAVLVTAWDGGVGLEVASGLANDHPELEIRRLTLGPDSLLLG